MEFSNLTPATLIKRYKRFLADVEMPDGSIITAHCANTGAMTGCNLPGSTVWLSSSDNPKRKYRYSWQLLETADGEFVCIHSALANQLVFEAIGNGVITELAGYPQIATEVKYGAENSRIDLLLSGEGSDCYVEVKCATLHQGDGLGLFPDAVSERGRKHLRELINMRQHGHRAVLLFCVQHTGIDRVAPADAIDVRYGETLREAVAAGVEVLAYACTINAEHIAVERLLPVLFKQPGLP